MRAPTPDPMTSGQWGRPFSHLREPTTSTGSTHNRRRCTVGQRSQSSSVYCWSGRLADSKGVMRRRHDDATI
jgi:hypothetical protein